MQILNAKAIANLNKHQYRSIDKSFLSNYLLKHYWNLLLKLFPLSVSPNKITFIGFVTILFNLLLVVIYDPYLLGPKHNWIYYSYGLGIWIYSTLDNIDGKQARRIKMSTPLGEVFDHGCDSLVCGLGSIIQCSAMGLGSNLTLVNVFIGITMLPFYFTTWEEYYTKTLYLGYINGPTEGIMVAVIVCFISGYYSVEVWALQLNKVFSNKLIEMLNIQHVQLKDAAVWCSLVIAIVFQTMFSLYSAKNACKEKGSRTKYTKALQNLGPVVMMYVCILVWNTNKNSIVVSRYPILFMLFTSTTFANIALQIIVARVCDMEYPLLYHHLVSLAFGCAIMFLMPIITTHSITINTVELLYTLVVCFNSIRMYLKYVLQLVSELCCALELEGVFAIKNKKDQ